MELGRCCLSWGHCYEFGKWLVTSGSGSVGQIQTGSLTPGHRIRGLGFGKPVLALGKRFCRSVMKEN